MIIRYSLEELTKIKGIAGVKGYDKARELFVSEGYMRLNNIDKNLIAKIKKEYDLNQATFNSGLIAFNTRIIQEDTFENLRSIIKRYSLISSGDESLINLPFLGRWKPLPKIYNLHPTYVLPLCNMQPRELDAVILHFSTKKPWDQKNPFYEEWNNNLIKAGSINLKKKQKARIWTNKEIRDYCRFLDMMQRKNIHRKILFDIYLKTDEYIGLFGIFLKKNLPGVYDYLNSIKRKKRHIL
jgi:lipopolysaccharide biosynthesis glycosyltransferase